MALFQRKTVGRPGEWFYNIRTQQVEEGPLSPGKDRFGPYASREEAAHAMETARERNVDWESDPRWHDRFGPDAEPGAGGDAPPAR